MLKVIPKKNFPFKLTLFLICSSFISALGTTPYGFRFAEIFAQYNYFLFLSIGIFFALMSLLANMALGAYSLTNINPKQNLINPYYLGIGSIISAIPFGFIGYFGFKDHLPFLINFSISLIIMIVNAGIAYSAIYNFLKDFTQRKTITPAPKWIGQLGFIIGFLVSLVIYVVTTHGITQALTAISGNYNFAFHTANIFAILSWIPFAALYSNSTKIVSEEAYVFITKYTKSIDTVNLALVIIAIGSGSSLTQIAVDFFNPSAAIPAFFKGHLMESFIHNFIVPFTFVSSAAVNYLALQRLYERVRRK